MRLEDLYDCDVSAMLKNAMRLPYLQSTLDDLRAEEKDGSSDVKQKERMSALENLVSDCIEATKKDAMDFGYVDRATKENCIQDYRKSLEGFANHRVCGSCGIRDPLDTEYERIVVVEDASHTRLQYDKNDDALFKRRESRTFRLIQSIVVDGHQEYRAGVVTANSFYHFFEAKTVRRTIFRRWH